MTNLHADNYIQEGKDQIEIDRITSLTLKKINPYLDLSNEELGLKAMFRDAVDDLLGGFLNLKSNPEIFSRKLELKKAAMKALEDGEADNYEFKKAA